MQNLSKLVSESRKKGISDEGILNLIREYLQVLILKAIYRSKYGSGLSFMGGTCLRICHDLKRYSEDLDFALDKRVAGYSFGELNATIGSFLKNTDFDVNFSINQDAVVQKSFVKVSGILHLFGLSRLKEQKLHVKLEVDTKPIKVENMDIETFFVTKFNEMFPILKHSDDTLFAGKIKAILSRHYDKGRDYYDLLWYLKRKERINLDYLNKALKQAKLNLHFKSQKDAVLHVAGKIAKINTDQIMGDIGRFLEDPDEGIVMKNYKTVFNQLTKKYLE